MLPGEPCCATCNHPGRIEVTIVETEWRKSGDIKVDLEDKKAVLLVHHAPRCENLAELVIHELLHIKLFAMDQMIEDLLEERPPHGARNLRHPAPRGSPGSESGTRAGIAASKVPPGRTLALAWFPRAL